MHVVASRSGFARFPPAGLRKLSIPSKPSSKSVGQIPTAYRLNPYSLQSHTAVDTVKDTGITGTVNIFSGYWHDSFLLG
jgi:hypothetical protein